MLIHYVKYSFFTMIESPELTDREPLVEKLEIHPPTGADASAVIELLRRRGVRFAAASFVDLHGKCKAKVVPLEHLAHAAEGSELFTGAALDGIPQEVHDDEVATHPDLTSGMIMPWRPDVAWFPGDLWMNGAPFAA
jgi:glutamine synthetase